MRAPVAIIGGGWAGLACAMELTDAGVPVTVFESARQLGGRARAVPWRSGGRTLYIDNGPHLMIGAYRETLRLLDRLGTQAMLDRRPLELILPGFSLRLPRLPSPFHLAWGLFAARGLRLAEKLAATAFIVRIQRQRFQLENNVSVAELLAGQPPALIDRLWAPICVAALNTPIEAASAQVFCNVLRASLMQTRADSDFLFARADLDRLFCAPAAEFIQHRGGEIRLGHRIKPADVPALYAGTHDGTAYASVVVAVHPAHVGDFMPAEIRLPAPTWEPIHTTWLRFAAPLPFPYPMLGLGPGQAPWAFARDDVAPGVVAIVTSADGPHLRQDRSQREAGYLAALEGWFGPLPALIDSLAITEKRATYACRPDLPRPPMRLDEHLYLASDYAAGPYPATLEGAVASGVQCARLILETAE